MASPPETGPSSIRYCRAGEVVNGRILAVEEMRDVGCGRPGTGGEKARQEGHLLDRVGRHAQCRSQMDVREPVADESVR
jgi:hypothetical protein